MSNKRQKHRGIPNVNSIKSEFTLNENDLLFPSQQTPIKEQRMIGNYVLHPRKGWRKVTVVDMLAYQNQIQTVMNTLRG